MTSSCSVAIARSLTSNGLKRGVRLSTSLHGSLLCRHSHSAASVDQLVVVSQSNGSGSGGSGYSSGGSSRQRRWGNQQQQQQQHRWGAAAAAAAALAFASLSSSADYARAEAAAVPKSKAAKGTVVPPPSSPPSQPIPAAGAPAAAPTLAAVAVAEKAVPANKTEKDDAAVDGGAAATNGKPAEKQPGLMREDSRSAMWPSKDRPKAGGMKIFSGQANPALAKEIASYLGINLGKLAVSRFADGEVNVMVGENVRGKDVYIVQPTHMPVNENLVELLLLISTMRRASARRITTVIPYYGYARQDRKMAARVPISAADVARLMEAMGVDRVVAVDLHCGQIQGFFGPRVPVDNLDGGIIGVGYFGDKDLHNPVVISPDAGGVYRAKKFREGLLHKYEMDAGLAMIVKQRAKANEVERMDLVGNVKDSDCIIVDDMIDTAGTLCKAAEVLKEQGARRVFAFASHGLFNGPANKRIANSALTEVVVLNTIPLSEECANNDKIVQLSVAHLIAQAVFNIHNKKSISALFK